MDSIKDRPLADLPPADAERLWELARAGLEARQLEDSYEDVVHGMELLCEVIDAQYEALQSAVDSGNWSDTEEAGKMAGLLEMIEIAMRTFENEAPEQAFPNTSEVSIRSLRRMVQPEPGTDP